MIYTAEDILLISVALTSRDRKIAQEFADEQPDANKQVQVYRNTLAVLATHRYFTMLGIDSEPEVSDCWNSAKRKVQDIADLFVPEIEDRVECRYIHSDNDRCYIPRNVWQNRAGYVVVELKDGEREGIIRGFVPEVSVEQLPLSYLQPLDVLFDRIALGAGNKLDEIVETLRNWILGNVGTEWKSPRELPKSVVMIQAEVSQAFSTEANDKLSRKIATLYRLDNSPVSLPPYQPDSSPIEALTVLVNQTQDDVTRWKAAELLHQVLPDHPSAATVKARDLGMYLSGHKIALLVGIIMKSDGKALVMTRVYPMGDLGILPEGVVLSGHKIDGETLFEVQSRQHDDYIQFLFTMDTEDQFMLKVSLESMSVAENFVI